MACFRVVKDELPARHILCFMLFTGFMVTFLQRINLNIAIVAMVPTNSNVSSVSDNTSSECYQEAHANEQVWNASTHAQSTTVSQDLYDWNEFEQSVILSSFFWGYVIFQIPGGRIAELWGPKVIFGGSILINGLLALVIPLVASLHWSFVLIVRMLQGLAQGTVFPCLNIAAARWAPPNERATFISFAMQGASLGNVFALPLCGWILTRWSWPQVFYMSGCVALVWSIAWYFLVYDSPSAHPRISSKEKEQLKELLSSRENVKNTGVPWVKALTSVQFLIGLLAGVGNDWGFHMFNNFGPKYIGAALGFGLEKSSWLASLPYVAQYIFAIAFAALCDVLLRKRIVSTLFVRKMSVIVSHLIPALGMIALTQVKCNAAMSIIILTISVSAIGAISCGFFQNPLDIAPNYAGSLTGVVNTVGALTAVISTPLTGAVLQSAGATKGWQIIFGLTACIYILTSLPYLLMATAKLQSWNNRNGKKIINS